VNKLCEVILSFVWDRPTRPEAGISALLMPKVWQKAKEAILSYKYRPMWGEWYQWGKNNYRLAPWKRSINIVTVDNRKELLQYAWTSFANYSTDLFYINHNITVKAITKIDLKKKQHPTEIYILVLFLHTTFYLLPSTLRGKCFIYIAPEENLLPTTSQITRAHLSFIHRYTAL
jgi:hypothetical protein